MEELKEVILNCNKCGNLQKQTENFIQIGKTPFILIGESPAKDGWIISKRAFYNKEGKLQASGRVVQRLLKILNLTIDDIYFTECCKCIISDRRQLDKCSQNCKPILLSQLSSLDVCKIILTMGKSPTQTLLNQKIEKFADYVGKTYKIKISNKEKLLIPIYHPSPLNPKGYKDNIPIFQHLKEVLQTLHI